MLSVNFNQDSSCVALGTTNGFKIYNTDPFTERFSRLEPLSTTSGIGIVEMLYKSNILALVGGGDNPKYPKNRLILWDDHQSKCIADLTFKSTITAVKMKRDTIVITLVDKTFIYNFNDLTLLYTIDTCANFIGIVALSLKTPNIIVTLGKTPGELLIKNSTLKKDLTIQAHTNPIYAIALDKEDGKLLASASERGTVIRLWSTLTGGLLKEFRRGLEVVFITSLVFDPNSTHLLVNSTKDTVHVFNINEYTQQEDKIKEENKRSSLVYFSNYLPQYFASEWSSVSFQVAPDCSCTFGSPNTIYAINNNTFNKYTLDLQNQTGILEDTIHF